MRTERGFTLLELLIGMTLLGFIVALLFGGFRLASTTWDAVEARTERSTDEQSGRALVRRLVTQIQPLRWNRAPNRPLAMAGEREVLRAVSPLSGQSGAGGLRVIELRVERDEGGNNGKGHLRLMLRHGPLRYDAEKFSDGLGDAAGHLVLGGLDAVEFSYYGSERHGETPRWQDTWSNSIQLPRLVRLHLVSSDSGWTDLTMAPAINNDRSTMGIVTAGPQ